MQSVLWFFIAYSFIGYCLEKIYVAAIHAPQQTRKCFLLLPLCPVYGFAIDVLAEEPPVHGSPLIEQPHCMVTPHIAWAPLQARRRCMQIVEDNIRAFQQGKPQNVVAG